MTTKRQQRARNRRASHSPARSGILGTVFGNTPSRTTRRRFFRKQGGAK